MGRKDKEMKIIVGCEESQEVTKAFRKLGHEAYSCDLIECSGGHLDWHFKEDILDVIKAYEWDLGIFHPPCQYITTTANRAFYNDPERWQKRVDAMVFVFKLMNSKIHKICIENPKGVIVSHIKHPLFGKPQYIQPYHHGHKDSKMTGLWLKNLPDLEPTNIVEPEWVVMKSSGKRMSKTHYNNSSTGKPENAKLRAKTYPGIAKAMAEQWGGVAV